MKHMIDILKQIQATNSSIEKESIIKGSLYNQLFVEVMQFLCNDFIQVGLSKKKIVKKTGLNESPPYDNLSDMMNYLKVNNTGTDKIISQVQSFIQENVAMSDREIIAQILTKEIKLGATSTIWNKVVDVYIQVPVFDVLLAKSYDDYEGKIDDELRKGYVITKKLDGLRCVAIIDEFSNVRFFTRQGKEYDGLVEIAKDIETLNLKSMVLDGELLSDSEGTNNEVYAETSSKARNKDKNKTGLIYNVFEMLPLEEFQNGISKLNTIDRKEALHKLLDGKNLQFVKEVEMLYCGNDISKIEYFGKYASDNEWEGVMISLNKPYECKRSSSLLKVKKFKTADCRVLGVVEGGNKNQGKLGAIVIEFEHKGMNHTCECGSGFTDEERVLYWNNPKLIVGQICEIKYFEVSQNQQGGHGLRFPVWLNRIRHDKTEISMY